ncbi:MAG: hypothetical protein WCZ12_03220 [Patescibacteria group bacterium]
MDFEKKITSQEAQVSKEEAVENKDALKEAASKAFEKAESNEVEFEREGSEIEALKVEDEKKAEEEVEKARKSIFEKFTSMFKGREKSDEEKYQDDVNQLKGLIKSLTHIRSLEIAEIGASIGGAGIKMEAAKSPEMKAKLQEIVELNSELAKMPKGQGKVDALYKKRRLIQELGSIGKKEIDAKYGKNAA